MENRQITKLHNDIRIVPMEEEEIEDIVVEALSDNSSEITKNIFDEMKQHTHVKIKNGFAYEDERSTNIWDDDEE